MPYSRSDFEEMSKTMLAVKNITRQYREMYNHRNDVVEDEKFMNAVLYSPIIVPMMFTLYMCSYKEKLINSCVIAEEELNLARAGMPSREQREMARRTNEQIKRAEEYMADEDPNLARAAIPSRERLEMTRKTNKQIIRVKEHIEANTNYDSKVTIDLSIEENASAYSNADLKRTRKLRSIFRN